MSPSEDALTIEHIADIMPNARANGLDREWDTLLETLRVFEINTKNRIAAFLMNVAKESGELYYVEELSDGWAYEWRADLGNDQPGDGPKYRGHGYIQITGRNNHRAVGKDLGIDVEGNPLLLTQLPYTWLSAAWYWRHGSSWGDLNDYADRGEYKSTILGVRGGADTDRERYWFSAMNALPDNVKLPKDEKPPPVPKPDPKPKPNPNPAPDDWPTTLVAIQEDGWLWVPASRTWLRGPVSMKFETDKYGWAYVPDATPMPEDDISIWKWPVGTNLPGYIGDGSYIDRHPTRWTWDPHVEKFARYVVDYYRSEVTANTYVDHPEGFGRDTTSVDLWGPGGRGDPIDSTIAKEIVDWQLADKKPPWIEWLIRNGYMWTPYNGWQWFSGDTSAVDNGHYRHIHITFKRV